uniref:TRAM domain-containing protein n=1 Tax=candidate division WOR-3 bacterium TaxID=2052148 RepID=A0A7V3RHR5_UNCW3
MLFFKREERFVLDSSSIIDGRIVNLFEKKFFEGKVIIPYLVKIIVRRKIGAEGDKLINNLKKFAPVEFVDKNVDGVIEEICVLKIAKKRKAKVITVSDGYDLYIKSFPDLRIINIKELYRILTPIFYPGRIITIRIIKKGLNPNEGVGYIEGVKVVVENGAKYLNQNVDVKVISMIQFETGNLVFGSVLEPVEKGNNVEEHSIKSEMKNE